MFVFAAIENRILCGLFARENVSLWSFEASLSQT
jgi:hypothetical protein